MAVIFFMEENIVFLHEPPFLNGVAQTGGARLRDLLLT